MKHLDTITAILLGVVAMIFTVKFAPWLPVVADIAILLVVTLAALKALEIAREFFVAVSARFFTDKAGRSRKIPFWEYVLFAAGCALLASVVTALLGHAPLWGHALVAFLGAVAGFMGLGNLELHARLLDLDRRRKGI